LGSRIRRRNQKKNRDEKGKESRKKWSVHARSELQSALHDALPSIGA